MLIVVSRQIPRYIEKINQSLADTTSNHYTQLGTCLDAVYPAQSVQHS